MEKIVQLIEDGILLKILWKQESERSDKRAVKEEILKSHVGKFCIEYHRYEAEITATTLTTILPNLLDIDVLNAAFTSFYENKKYKIETRENNTSISLSSLSTDNANDRASLTISIQIFIEKRKIVVQGGPKQLLDFVKSYHNILDSIDQTHQNEDKYSNLADKIFTCNVSNMDFP